MRTLKLREAEKYFKLKEYTLRVIENSEASSKAKSAASTHLREMEDDIFTVNRVRHLIHYVASKFHLINCSVLEVSKDALITFKTIEDWESNDNWS